MKSSGSLLTRASRKRIEPSVTSASDGRDAAGGGGGSVSTRAPDSVDDQRPQPLMPSERESMRNKPKREGRRQKAEGSKNLLCAAFCFLPSAFCSFIPVLSFLYCRPSRRSRAAVGRRRRMETGCGTERRYSWRCRRVADDC